MAKQKRVFLFKFESQYLCTATFMRFAEHYESPVLRGKIFGTEQCMDRYAQRHKRGEFTYFTDWQGFNLPSSALRPFYDGKFDPLTEKERALLEFLKDVTGNFYVIATSENHPATLKHEFLHSLFCLFPEYQSDVIKAINEVRGAKRLARALVRDGYSSDPRILLDEINAYAVTGEYDYPKAGKKLKGLLRDIFRKHFGFDITRTSAKKLRETKLYRQLVQEVDFEKRIWNKHVKLKEK